MEKALLLDLKTISKDFKEFLDAPKSERVILTAPFGAGKTYFLKSFFKEYSEYNVVYLRPVNYSVANNEDIFRLIKHDILFELLKHPGIEFENLHFDNTTVAYFFIQKDFTELLKPFVALLPELGKKIHDAITGFEKLFQTFKKYKKDVESGTKEEVVDFLQRLSLEEGSIYESGIITQTIVQFVNSLKQHNEKTVLVIDDLDRIDPAHIFRILNVFAAHFDLDDIKENKFNFDHIILVCDIENIRKIFSSVYGQDVDFNGYVNKFYTKHPFYLNNKKSLSTKLDGWLRAIHVDNSFAQELLQESDNIFRKWLVFFLTRMINNGNLTLRALKAINEYQYKNYRFSLMGNWKFESHQFGMFQIFDFLIFIFGGNINLFKRALESTTFTLTESADHLSLESHYTDYLVGELLMFFYYRENGFKPNTYRIMHNDKSYVYKIPDRIDRSGYILSQIDRSGKSLEDQPDFGRIDMDELMKNFFHVYAKTLDRRIY